MEMRRCFLDDSLDRFVFDCRRLFVDLSIPDFFQKGMYIQYMYFSLQPENYENYISLDYLKF